jgi:hypothetical protein
MPELDFPAWIRITHFINIIFISFLIRRGIEILGTHPKLRLRPRHQACRRVSAEGPGKALVKDPG